MSFESALRTDILPEELTENQQKVKIVAETQFHTIVNNSENAIERTQTPNPAKNIIETMSLIKDSIEHCYTRTHITGDAEVQITYENPDTYINLETVSICLEQREPGMYGQGRPFENKTKNLRPILREVKDDPDNLGYKLAILGYFYDNILRLTCWARTNKVANNRALWLENVMEEYSWYFTSAGVNRFLYYGRDKEIVRNVDNNKIYGRPIDYYVRTEKIRAVSQKTLEEIYIHLSTGTYERNS